MNFLGAGFTQHADDFAAGGAPHDGIVDQDDAFALEGFRHGGVFHARAEVADGLFGLNEGASLVVAADEAHLDGNARLLGKPQRRAGGGIGDGDHDVGPHRRLLGQTAAQGLARLVDAASENLAVRTGEIDELEHAMGLGGARQLADDPGAVPVHGQNLAGPHFPDELGADDVERAGFRGDHVGPVQPAQMQGPHPPGVADGVQGRGCLDHQGVGARDLLQGVLERRRQVAGRGFGHQMENDFRVRRGLKNGPQPFQPLAQRPGVGEVAVVADGDGAPGRRDHDGLRVGHRGGSRRGVAHVAHGHPPFEAIQDVLLENVRHEPHGHVGEEFFSVGTDDPGRLLAPVLELLQTQVGQAGSFGVVVNAENTALLVQNIERAFLMDQGHITPGPRDGRRF